MSNWEPPAEYLSQTRQDLHEPSDGLQLLPKVAPLNSEDELQWILWGVGLRVDVQIDQRNRDFILIGNPQDVAKAEFYKWQYVTFKQARGSKIWNTDWRDHD